MEKQYIGMAGRSVEDKVPYQATLRAVGKYLDERVSHHLNLIELPDGYNVRYQGDEPESDQAVAFFSWQQLLGQNELLGQRREKGESNRFSSRDTKPELNATGPKDGYENFLRALGYELDRTEAYTITLDELDNGILLTYLFIDARESFMPHKRMVFLTPKELDTVKQDALHRRVSPIIEPRRRGTGKLLR
jgi:hypothetical protein